MKKMEWQNMFRSASSMPELNIAIFAFLLNFVWEFLQVPFFQFVPQLSHWEGIKLCAAAAVADVTIVLLGFWIVAIIERSRHWILAPRTIDLGIFVGFGVLTAIGIERTALAYGSWFYSGDMPIIPIIEVGLLPVLQWLILPPLALWFTYRQLD